MEEEEKGRPRPRIESLSDLIFGLALSIGALALVTNPPTTDAEFYRDMATFGFNFIVLISIWLRYTRIMSALPIETRGTAALNTLLLFTVSLEPFIFNIIRSGNSPTPPSVPLFEAASSFYGIDLGVMMLLMAVFTLALADEERKLVPASMVKQLRSESATWFVSSAIFLASAIPVFGRIDLGGVLVTGLSIRTLMWLLAVIVAWLRAGHGRHIIGD